MDALPEDMVANVLGRLPPRSLAASRCVRKHWCSIIDTRRLLRADLLPLRLDGFFCDSHLTFVVDNPYFFTRPSTARRIGGRLDFVDYAADGGFYMDISGHCNGLLLLHPGSLVVKPATRQWALLPRCPEPCGTMKGFRYQDYHLAYDPMVSPHYQVFAIPGVPTRESVARVQFQFQFFEEHSEWPPSPYTTRVFSSRKWRWEERSFVRQGEALGTIADHMHPLIRPQSVYFRGALYVYCQNDSVMRIGLSNDKYRMVRSPLAGSKIADLDKDDVLHFGKSEKGVYSTLLWLDTWPHFRVWLLNEFNDGQVEWMLKSNISLQAVVDNFIPSHDISVDEYNKQKAPSPWIVNYYNNNKKEPPAQEESAEWDFDDGIILETKYNMPQNECYATYFLGFHPYKEIAFFYISGRAFSYHLNSSKVQYLGDIYVPELNTSFPYTPCWMAFENNNELI